MFNTSKNGGTTSNQQQEFGFNFFQAKPDVSLIKNKKYSQERKKTPLKMSSRSTSPTLAAPPLASSEPRQLLS